MIHNINYQIWFKVCRPIRVKYKLSTNCVMVLNGSYVYSKYINHTFSRRKIAKFVSYYNSHKTDLYLNVLINKGYIIESGLFYNRQVYTISSEGIRVIEELNNSYDIELLKFCSTYNIDL